jgi:hypothetical protein
VIDSSGSEQHRTTHHIFGDERKRIFGKERPAPPLAIGFRCDSQKTQESPENTGETCNFAGNTDEREYTRQESNLQPMAP